MTRISHLLHSSRNVSLALVMLSFLYTFNAHANALLGSSENELALQIPANTVTDDTPYPSNAAYTGDINSTSNTSGSMNTSETESLSVPINISEVSDLLKYENSVLQNEEDVSYIDSTSNENTISVWWKHHGTLLMFIPVSVESRTSISVSNKNILNITSELPWWSIFVKDATNVVTQTGLNLEQSNEIKTHMKMAATPEAKARVVHTIVTELASETRARN